MSFLLSLFVRLAALAVLATLICSLIWWGLTTVRQQAWQEALAAPVMSWLAATPSAGSQYHWLSALYEFRTSPVDDLDLDNVARERLGYGHTLVKIDALGTRVLVARSQNQLLSLRFRDLYRDLAEASALIILSHLDEVPPSQRQEALALLSETLAVETSLLAEAGRLPPEPVLERAWARGLAYWREDAQGRVLLRLEDGTLVTMAMPSDFQPLPWPVLVLLVTLVALVILVVVRVLVRDLDENLRAVESVAVRIARGELNARVEPGREKLVSRLAQSFNGMADQIQRLVDVQREMIHAVSHELRTPVARIRFGVQMIETAKDREALQKQLDGIDGDIQELDELIDEILTYARLEQGGPVFSLRPGRVTEIVRQVVEEQKVIHSQVRIEAVIPDSSLLFDDSDIEPRYLHRAVQNLVGNACRYARGEVRVACLLDESNCRINVEDDGPGIPEEDWEKVFSAFARLDDSRTRQSGGYGLGLSIVRRILYWHGGQSFVGKSESLGGARFSLVWPRRQSSGLSGE